MSCHHSIPKVTDPTILQEIQTLQIKTLCIAYAHAHNINKRMRESSLTPYCVYYMSCECVKGIDLYILH